MKRLAHDRYRRAYRDTEMLAEMFSVDDERQDASRAGAAHRSQMREATVDRVHSVTLRTANLARSVNFYARAFGFRLVVGTGGRRPRRVVLHAARTRLALEEHSPERSSRCARASLAVEDFDAARARAWELGIATTQEDGDGAGARCVPRHFVVHDPDGHEIVVVDRRAH